MKYCVKCLQPDTRPNTVFREGGICPACDYVEHSKDIDWSERIDILHELLQKAPKAKGGIHKCIIGVSGGKDSTRQALWVREKFGIKPLLAMLSYPPEQITERGAENVSNLINLGFDLVISAPAPKTWRYLVKEGFLQFTNWAKSTELALYGFVPQLAIRYKIPTILWGENPALQLGDLTTLGKNGYDGNNLRNMNTLSGGKIDWIRNLKNITDKQLFPYHYPTPEEFEKNKIQIVYLGWFLEDWALKTNASMSSMHGLKLRDDIVENTGDLMGVSALDEDWVTLNQQIKYYKYGFGRVTDYVNDLIRNGELTRDEGIQLVENYDDSCSDEYIDSFCKYIDISVTQYWEIVFKSVNKELFRVKDGKVFRMYKVGKGI